MGRVTTWEASAHEDMLTLTLASQHFCHQRHFHSQEGQKREVFAFWSFTETRTCFHVKALRCVRARLLCVLTAFAPEWASSTSQRNMIPHTETTVRLQQTRVTASIQASPSVPKRPQATLETTVDFQRINLETTQRVALYVLKGAQQTCASVRLTSVVFPVSQTSRHRCRWLWRRSGSTSCQRRGTPTRQRLSDGRGVLGSVFISAVGEKCLKPPFHLGPNHFCVDNKEKMIARLFLYIIHIYTYVKTNRIYIYICVYVSSVWCTFSVLFFYCF